MRLNFDIQYDWCNDMRYENKNKKNAVTLFDFLLEVKKKMSLTFLYKVLLIELSPLRGKLKKLLGQKQIFRICNNSLKHAII